MKRILTLVTAALLALIATTAYAKRAPRTLADMIKVGHYSWVNPDINETSYKVKPERFTTAGVEVVAYGKVTMTEEILADLDRRDYRPASIEELLAYGAANPKPRSGDPIIALGSSWMDYDGRRTVAYLRGRAGWRELGLYWDDPSQEWGIGDSFLAVRKPAAPAVRTLADMIAAGHYDGVYKNITEEDFPVKPERFTTKGTKIFHFDAAMSPEQIDAAMSKRGYEPASIEHLLAYGAKHPEEQLKHTIIALYPADSPWRIKSGLDGHIAPMLAARAGKRAVGMSFLFTGGWDTSYWFLAVRK